MHLRAEQPCVRMDPAQDQPRTEGIGQGAVLMDPELKSVDGIVGKWCPYNPRILCQQKYCQDENCLVYQEWLEMTDHEPL